MLGNRKYYEMGNMEYQIENTKYQIEQSLGPSPKFFHFSPREINSDQCMMT